MPELPEVETIRRELSKIVVSKVIRAVAVQEAKSFVGDANEVLGAQIARLKRRGKALLVELNNNKTMMVHLRMTGQLIWRGDNKGDDFAGGHPNKSFIDELPNAQTRVIFELSGGRLFFNDQRKFGFVKLLPTAEVEQDAFIASLAKEPWEMEASELYEQCQRHGKAPIKAVLLDQKVIAGLGNIYADESLFFAGVHPATKAGKLQLWQVEKILEGASTVMTAAIESGGSTMATYIRPDGSTGDYLEKFAQVFRREGKACPKCGAIIKKTRVAGRGTHFCPECQRQIEN